MKDANARFLELFLSSYPSLYGFVVARGVPPDSAEDVVQNVAGVLWEKFGTYEEGTNFKAWAFAVARFEVLRFWDKERHSALLINLDERTLEQMEQIEIEGGGELVEFRKDLLQACLEKLGDDARRLIEMRYVEDVPFEEMAKRTGKTSQALRIRVHRIRRWLKGCVQGGRQGAKV